jgi:polar amino acid transport system substrate-binding protein
MSRGPKSHRDRCAAASAGLIRVAALVASMLAWPGCAAPAYHACDDDAEYPPYTYLERVDGKPTGRVVGYSVDLLTRLLGSGGFSVELLDLRRCLVLARQGERFQIVMNLARDEERERDFLLTRPFYYLESYYYYSREKYPRGPKIHRLRDLHAFRICGRVGYSYEAYGLRSADIVTRLARLDQLVNMVLRDRCDLFIEKRQIMDGQRIIDPAVRRLVGDPDLAREPVPGVPDVAYYMMVSRAAPDAHELVARLNDGLSRLEESGESIRLLRHYVSGPAAPEN